MCKYAAGIHFMYTILLISNHKILLADRTSTSWTWILYYVYWRSRKSHCHFVNKFSQYSLRSVKLIQYTSSVRASPLVYTSIIGLFPGNSTVGGNNSQFYQEFLRNSCLNQITDGLWFNEGRFFMYLLLITNNTRCFNNSSMLQ